MGRCKIEAVLLGIPGARRLRALAPRGILALVLLVPAVARAQAPGQGPPPAVTVAHVETMDVAPRTEFIGRVEAVQAVDIRARVQGFLRTVEFQEGQDVRAGELLFTIEPEAYEAALAEAKAQLARAQAALRNAELNLERRKTLRERDAVSQAELDQAIADRNSAAAEAAAAEAGVRIAEINLGYTRITAPIAGRMGRAAVTAGNLVGPDSGPLARLVQLDPIRVVFSVSERDVTTIRQQWVRLTLSQIGAQFVPTLRLANGSEYPEPGKIAFIDNEVDRATGTVAVRAMFPNPNSVLLPGGTVMVMIRPAESKVMPVVPLRAVQESREGAFVLVVDAQNRVAERQIRTGTQVGQVVAVEDGLKPGETIIVDGLQKVRPGGVVQPVPAKPPFAGQQGGR